MPNKPPHSPKRPCLASTDLDSSSFLWGQLSQALLDWYGHAGRDLPWRRTRDVYAIWISEIMLQQTQVKTVLPYYDRWLKQFPDFETLAAADLQTVLKAWEGLGYYSRAKNLHRTAQAIVADFDGQFPQDLDQVMSLPGIGRTTAGGILSAAFNLPLPIMDGNVKRVLARLVGLEQPPAKALPQLWEVSSNLVPAKAGRDFNQALMDLGATLCTPKQPACDRCPWAFACQAKAQHRQTALPIVERKAPLPHRDFLVAVVSNSQAAILIHQRPDKGLLANLWDFPTVEVEGLSADSSLEPLTDHLMQNFGLTIEPRYAILQVHHTYTHFKATYHVYQCDCETVVATNIQGKWVGVKQLTQFPFPKSHLKIIDAIRSLP
ncbi:MAG: A/G-specific adenine glycosylase [Cyanobacteriota bacterium]|jgi:A/G-specific adenine glycosylase